MENAMKKKLTIAAGALAVLAVAAVVAVALVFLFVETASERKEEAHRKCYPYAAADAPPSFFRRVTPRCP
jgi:flagellar basal body-associated protein FliL